MAESSAVVLARCCATPSRQAAVVAAGAVPPLVRLLSFPQRPKQEAALETLAALCTGNPATSAALLSHDTVLERLLCFLRQGSSNHTRYTACLCLTTLCQHLRPGSRHRKQELQQAVLPVLVKLLGEADVSEDVPGAARAFGSSGTARVPGSDAARELVARLLQACCARSWTRARNCSVLPPMPTRLPSSRRLCGARGSCCCCCELCAWVGGGSTGCCTPAPAAGTPPAPRGCARARCGRSARSALTRRSTGASWWTARSFRRLLQRCGNPVRPQCARRPAFACARCRGAPSCSGGAAQTRQARRGQRALRSGVTMPALHATPHTAGATLGTWRWQRPCWHWQLRMMWPSLRRCRPAPASYLHTSSTPRLPTALLSPSLGAGRCRAGQHGGGVLCGEGAAAAAGRRGALCRAGGVHAPPAAVRAQSRAPSAGAGRTRSSPLLPNARAGCTACGACRA